MGELANDTVEGLRCSWCGVYFEEPHGYPVVCEHCKETTEDYDFESDPLVATNKEL